MRIVTAGMKRSGSTWLFNVVRMLAERQYGKRNVYSAWYGDYDRADKREVHIVKVHGFDRSLVEAGTLVFTSARE